MSRHDGLRELLEGSAVACPELVHGRVAAGPRLDVVDDELRRQLRHDVRAVWKDQIVFLRKTENGVTERSYGIEVAQLAGVRSGVIARAKEILKDLENQPTHQAHQPKQEVKATEHSLISEIKNLNVDELSPKQAMDLLYTFKNKL